MSNKLKDVLVYILYGLIFLIITALLYFLKPNVDAMSVVGNIVQLIVPFFAGFAIIFLFNPRVFGDPKRSLPWIFIGLGFIAWALGQVVFTYMETILKIKIPDVSWPDIGFLLMYPLVFIEIGRAHV